MLPKFDMIRNRMPDGIGILDSICFLAAKYFSLRLQRKGILDVGGDPRIRRRGVGMFGSPESTYKRLICLTGFGYSGSGAVADLLSEYDNTTVVSFLDRDSSLKKESDGSSFEFDMLRHLGGFFSLELALATENDFVKDALVRVFLRMISWLYFDVGGIFNDNFLLIMRGFMDEIIDIRSESNRGWDTCYHLRVLGNNGASLLWGKPGETVQCYYYLKKLSVVEYRKIAKHYIEKILKLINSADDLILDQACSDYSADIGMYEDYLGRIKLLAVYRDPRDVYVTGRMKGEDFIPRDTDAFIRWYANRLRKYIALKHPDFKLIRFEDLVLNYDATVATIEDFLQLDHERHKMPNSCFDPNTSCKNICLHKSFSDQRVISKIHDALKEYCYA